jgi:transposase
LSETPPKDFQKTNDALSRARAEIRILEESLHEQSRRSDRLQQENERLREEVERLKEEILNLRGVPEWVKPNQSEEERRKQKKRGPKKGHPPHPRKVPERIDREVRVIAKKCPYCENPDLPEPTRWHTHTQIDLPHVLPCVVTRYHVGWSWCSGCDREVSLSSKLSRSKYGPRVHAQVSYWKYQLGLTLGKIQRLLEDQYALEMSTGQIAEVLHRSAQEFHPVYEDLELKLVEETYLHADETGWRESGNSRWLWSFSNHRLSYYHIDPSRGQKVVEEVLGQSYGGVLVSDFYGAYHRLKSVKQKCWTHLLREVREIREEDPKNLEIRNFMKQMKRFFRRGVTLQEKYQEGQAIEKRLARLQEDTLKLSRRKFRHPDLQRLCKRLIKYRGELYTFVTSGVDPTNNNAEREIRPAVLMRKTSYGNRSPHGAQAQSVLMSVIRTCAKQNINFVDFATAYLAKTKSSLEFG